MMTTGDEVQAREAIVLAVCEKLEAAGVHVVAKNFWPDRVEISIYASGAEEALAGIGVPVTRTGPHKDYGRLWADCSATVDGVKVTWADYWRSEWQATE